MRPSSEKSVTTIYILMRVSFSFSFINHPIHARYKLSNLQSNPASLLDEHHSGFKHNA